MKRMSPFTFTFSDGEEADFERSFYALSAAAAQKLASEWATRMGFRLVS